MVVPKRSDFLPCLAKIVNKSRVNAFILNSDTASLNAEILIK